MAKFMEDGTIQVKALASIRGMSYTNTFIICDEMQGTVANEIQAITTRIGKNTKMVIMGDTRQSDVKKSKQDGLSYQFNINLNFSIIFIFEI
jgi:phosphate starvation-inducible PhoH-like protein